MSCVKTFSLVVSCGHSFRIGRPDVETRFEEVHTELEPLSTCLTELSIAGNFLRAEGTGGSGCVMQEELMPSFVVRLQL